VISLSQNPVHQLEKMLLDKDNKIARAYFSPDDGLSSLLKGLIDAEKKRILVAIYTITDRSLVNAFIEASKRGVLVEFVVDPGYGSDRYSQVFQLANAQIGVWSYQSSANERQASLMHNKFCLFDDSIGNRPLVWTGSYNFTKRANERNQENVIILDDKPIIDRFHKQFEILKGRSLQISGKVQTSSRSTVNSEPSLFDRLKTFMKMF
ncbi:hypothetical protein H0W26_05250, partial [Candidatus Dependentiae bacterium]|nr:hypothetical protein [Candidatus Dependentiae bacterium]